MSLNINLLNSLIVVIIATFFMSCKCSDDITTFPPPCNSTIYCHGELLHTIQMAHLYPDSKTFVDMKLRRPPNETLESFQRFMNDTNNNPSKKNIADFVNEHFEKPGKEFEAWQLADWKANPKFLQSIHDPEYKQWASKLNSLWNFLGRKMIDDVEKNQDLYSIIYVPNPVVVPGGRFREFYYWDSYWIIKGLLYSEMYDTARGMLLNFLSVVDKYGFIPNGGRIYYARRSQPPLLIPMIQAYYEETKDIQFIKDNIDTMEAEFQFWYNNHTVQIPMNGRYYQLFIYKDYSSGPRPESYREDVLTAQHFTTERDKHEFYAELKAAAESGWDFSSRWFIRDNGDREGNLTHLHTRSVVPVELNAFMYWNARLLRDYQIYLNNDTAAAYYSHLAEKIKDAVTAVLWDDKEGVWLDYDLINHRRRDYFYPTNIAPLWTECYDKSTNITDQVMQYLWRQNEKLISIAATSTKNHLGGIPTTLYHSGEQWDYPNAWPPLQYIMIMALNSTGNEYAQELAFEISDRWVRTNFIAFNATNSMYEKYDSREIGGHGGGGEYEVQLGFGWTNGVILELLAKYGDRLTAVDQFDNAIEKDPQVVTNLPPYVIQAAGGSEARTFITALLVITISLAVGFIG
ncbi:trehalase isoform X2 [Chrysoperla carnea]|nr:trehalase isoform X2 [Chrysoperla carnea]